MLDRPLVAGVVNVTPDSFSDGGNYLEPGAAIAHAQRLMDEGADLVDIGAESSRPGASSVSAEQELSRLMPVLDGLRACPVPISVDTTKPEVMRAVIDAGAAMINDVNALRAPGALETVADSTAAGGAVLVGDIVDLLFTFQFDPSKFLTGNDTNRMADFSAKIVLQNVVIVARTASVYTIRTDAQTAEKISYLNSAGGQLQMLLRAGQDQRQVTTAGATFVDIYKFGIKIPTKTAP